METVETLEDANAAFANPSMGENIDVIVPEELAMELAAPDDQEESMPDEVETGRGGDDTVMEHSVDGTDDTPVIDVEMAQGGGGDEIMADPDDTNTRDTLPMYDEASTGEEGVVVAGPSEGAAGTADAEMKEESPSTEGENSQSIPENNETITEQLDSGSVLSTFPHCYVCGFDRETVLMKEKRGNSGAYKNKVIYRNRCVRKLCNRFFGPSYVWDTRLGCFVRSAEETAAANRPYATAPREEKYPDIDYERAAESGIRVAGGGAGAVTGTPKTIAKPATPVTTPSAPNGTASPSPAVPAATPPNPAASRTAAATAARMAARASTVAAATSAKKLRKGYQWVTEPGRSVPQPSTSTVRDTTETRPRVQRRNAGCQTGDVEQVEQFVADEIRTKAVFKGLRKDETVPLSGAVSSRLFLAQKTIMKQMKEITQLRSERDGLLEALKKCTTNLGTFRQDVMTDMQRLKDDVVVANRELKNFSCEMQSEADKDVRMIKKIKEEIAKRLDDTDRYRRKIDASLEYQQKLTKEAQRQADQYHQASVYSEQKMRVARLEAQDAAEKLNDKMFLTNAKCTHCQVTEKINAMLEEQVAEKTTSANNLGKERQALAKKVENADRINNILTKENQKLKFESKAWESTCHRQKAELQALKGNNSGVVVLPPSLPSTSIGEAAFTPQSTTMKEADEVSPDRVPLDDVVEEERPQPTVSSRSANSEEEGEYHSPSPNTLAKLPPPPVPPVKLKDLSPEHDNAFSAWIPKDRKQQDMPSEMAEAMRKVEEALEKGPPPKKEKREEREREKGKRSAGAPQHSSSNSKNSHKNGEKKPKLEEKRKKEDVLPPRPIPTLSGGSKGPPTAGVLQKMADREKGKRKEEKKKEASPVPYSSVHEPAFPAVVAPKKAVTVPYNGPSTLMAASSSSSASSSPAPTAKHRNSTKTPEKKPISFLPVAGSTGMLPPPAHAPPPREPSRIVPVDAILREAERLREIEREREMRRERERQMNTRNDPFYDYELNAAAAAAAASADRRERMQPLARPRFDMDDDLPWNQGRPQSYQQAARPTTPTQDWYYDAPAASHAPPPRPLSPRYYDDGRPPPLHPLPARDAYGRLLDVDYGRRPHPQPLMQQPLPPPGHRGGPPPGDVWRRDWHEPTWSEEAPRRSYWE